MRLRAILVCAGAALVLAACSLNLQLPSGGGSPSLSTVVALTLQALGTPPASSGNSPPILSITADSNCRSGPGTSYKIITAFTAGTTVEIVGRNSEMNYWQVKVPVSGETCWVWGQYAVASGSYDSLPESGGSSGSAAGAPARPSNFFYKYTCPFGNLTTVLTWGDAADNETGYHVYRFDQLIADLPANSTTYTDVLTVTPGSSLQYSVEAYNGVGVSPRRTESFSCQ